jgi:tRNA U55 pseudouridine synthase TruB
MKMIYQSNTLDAPESLRLGKVIEFGSEIETLTRMNRACFKTQNCMNINQHATSPAKAGQAIQPIKNNFAQMKKTRLQ